MKLFRKEYKKYKDGYIKTTYLSMPVKKTIKTSEKYIKKFLGIVYKKKFPKHVNIDVKNNYELKIAFLVGCKDGRSERYYVTDVCESFRKKNIFTKCFYDSYEMSEDVIKIFDAIVFFRVNNRYDKNIDKIVEIASENNISVIYNIDDLIFDETVIDALPSYNTWTEEKKINALKDCIAYQETIYLCDAAIVSSNYLVERMKKYVHDVYMFPALISNIQYNHAHEINKSISHDDSVVKICYLSGTASHNNDFKIVEDVLIKILKKYQQVRLVLAGPLELSSKFDEVKSQVIRQRLMDYRELIKFNASMDINIAPLADNAFNKAKTPLKITESALVKVPTVASGIPSYRECIINGKNGFIATTEDEWFDCIETMVINDNLRKKCGENAYNTLVKNFYIENNIDNIIKIYKLIIDKRHNNCNIVDMERKSNSVAFLIPAPFANSGGHRNIFRAVKHLRDSGYNISVYYTDSEKNSRIMKKFCSYWFYPMDNVNFFQYTGDIAEHDIAIATFWTTAYELKALEKKFKHIFYFVQDYEALFYPMSSEYILAENSYRLGFHHICSGPWIHHAITRRFNADSEYFQFPVDTSIYNTDKTRAKENKNIIFFAKPEMPRRCYELGIRALKILSTLRPDVEIILYGSNQLNENSISFKATIKNILPTINDLADLYRDADLGLVFSTTNPSLVPYEMLACGCPVADLNLPDTLCKYGDSEDNVFLLDPLPMKMAQQLVEILDSPELLKRKAECGKLYVEREFPSEEEMGNKVEQIIKSRIG